MNKEEIREIMVSLKPFMDAINSGSAIKISTTEQAKLKKVYNHLLPGKRMDGGCSDCVKFALIYVFDNITY